MFDQSTLLVVVGCCCLTFTLFLAWCLVGVRVSARVKVLFPNYQYLLKAHIDYLLMTGLLMLFFLLFAHFRVTPSPIVVVVAMCIGSVRNPAGFLALAIKPNLRQDPASPFGVVMTGSFTMTTIGYAGAAWSVARAAVAG